MKWTPQKAITSASAAAALRERPSESPTKCGHVLDLGHLVVVGEDHGVALLGERAHLVLHAGDLLRGRAAGSAAGGRVGSSIGFMRSPRVVLRRFLPYDRKPMHAKHSKVSDSEAKTPRRRGSPTHVTLAVVLQVRGGRLSVLLWQRAKAPVRGRLVAARRLPRARARRSSSRSARQLAAQGRRGRAVAGSSSSRRSATPSAIRDEWQLATAYLGLVPLGLDPGAARRTRRWHPVDRLPDAGLRPRGDRARRPRAPAGQAVLHEHRLRARARALLDLRADAPSTPPRSATRSTPPTCAACSSAAACSRPPASAAPPGRAAAGRRPCTASARASSR